jgi:hypothetical protein
MARRLSSAATFVMKMIFPVVWLLGFGAGTLGLWLGVIPIAEGSVFPQASKWIFLGFFGFGVATLVQTCLPLKRVRLTQDALLVSNYWRELHIPLRDVYEVTEKRWLNVCLVAVHVRHPIAFGRRVVFLPKMRWCDFSRPHPIVAELRRRIRQARG